MAGSSLAEVFPRLSAVHALSMLRPRMRPPPPLAAPADADALATAAAGASSADNGVARVWRTWPLPAAAGRATNTEEPISNGRSPADSIFPAPLVSSSAKRKRDGIRSDDSEFGEEEDEDVESVEENDAIAAHDRNPHCSHESSAAALTSAVGFAYPADQAWQWQAWQESTCYSWARSVLSPTTQDGDNAVSRAEEVETCSTVAPLAQDVPDHSTEEEQLIHARCMEAVADMWEPHRRQYGEYAWWAQDQPFERRKFIRCGDTFGETLEFEELPECGEVAVQAEPKDNAQNGRRSTFGADIAHLVGKVWSIDELLREVANLDDAEFFEEPEGGVGVSRSRLQRYGMTVERDVVYDESELTPEEIAIQRWSVEWRKTRALQRRREEEALYEQEKARTRLRESLLAESELKRTYAYKAAVFPRIYGTERAFGIAGLEAACESRFFELSGGVGADTSALSLAEDISSQQRQDREEDWRNCPAPRATTMGMSKGVKSQRRARGTDRILWPVIPIRL